MKKKKKKNPPPATNRTITALSPPTLVATIVQIVIPIGAIASQTTYIGFTLSDCSNPESILAKTLFNQGSVNMTQALDAGTYHICYTTNSTLGWVMQLNAGDDNPISVKTGLFIFFSSHPLFLFLSPIYFF